MGIYGAAAITTVVVVLAYGVLISRLAPREDRHVLLFAFLVALPLQPLAFYLVRVPLHASLSAALGTGAALTVLTLFYAPVTEEPAKWLTLLVPAIRRSLRPNNALALALAVGLGFGVGEIWFLAQNIARAPEAAALPFYMFGGFFIERAIVCFLHGAFVAFPFTRLAGGRSFLVGGLIGMAFHFMLNLPVFLVAIDPFSLGEQAWQGLSILWVVIVAVLLAIAVAWLWRKGKAATLRPLNT